MDLAITALAVSALFGLAGSRVARHHGRPGWLGFVLAALVPPLGVVAAVWALAADLPPATGASVRGPRPTSDLGRPLPAAADDAHGRP